MGKTEYVFFVVVFSSSSILSLLNCISLVYRGTEILLESAFQVTHSLYVFNLLCIQHCFISIKL